MTSSRRDFLRQCFAPLQSIRAGLAAMDATAKPQKPGHNPQSTHSKTTQPSRAGSVPTASPPAAGSVPATHFPTAGSVPTAGCPNAGPVPAATQAGVSTQVAVIHGRHCLAYQRSFCSTCLERCPVEGALFRRDGLPMVNPDLCNGCGLCLEPCPAPTQAIRLLPRPNPTPPRQR